jgi:hypothetical protein
MKIFGLLYKFKSIGQVGTILFRTIDTQTFFLYVGMRKLE